MYRSMLDEQLTMSAQLIRGVEVAQCCKREILKRLQGLFWLFLPVDVHRPYSTDNGSDKAMKMYIRVRNDLRTVFVERVTV